MSIDFVEKNTKKLEFFKNNSHFAKQNLGLSLECFKILCNSLKYFVFRIIKKSVACMQPIFDLLLKYFFIIIVFIKTVQYKFSRYVTYGKLPHKYP